MDEDERPIWAGRDEDDEAPRRALPAKRRRRRWVAPLVVLLALAVVAAGGLFVYASSLQQRISENLDRTAELPDESLRPSAAPEAPGGDGAQPVNVVLMGSDSRGEGDAGRSDTLMVAHLSGDRQTAYLISFPRDMWVEIPGRGMDKINAAYAYGGTALTVATIEGLLDARMDHLAVVDFTGFIELTDAVGGVTVDNEHAFSSHGHDYPVGEVELSGEKALWFVRERKSLPEGDLDRAENQRKVVQAIVAKGISPQVLADPGRFTAFVGGIAAHTQVSSGLTDQVIRETALSLRLDGRDDIVSLQAPISGFGTSPGGASIDVVDEAQLAEMAEALQQDTMDEYVSTYPPE
ncbi:LCP family protein [Auraticoccus monumenti]|uniref:Cell envelope-related function transcriptional attenuator common domain-containing protein n=1 Tax=Auraticoccus monumenti TaxID=675864 RepID=A0A1G6ZLP4_9ACTN|nr:LCP family protein [Auraticoccus monumenti]SDE03568.1 cell envelope-related function transcriptional attenuator common domain-containing protein [Auraticoccus monumenti]